MVANRYAQLSAALEISKLSPAHTAFTLVLAEVVSQLMAKG
jgi:hypothetical protein